MIPSTTGSVRDICRDFTDGAAFLEDGLDQSVDEIREQKEHQKPTENQNDVKGLSLLHCQPPP